MLTNFEISEISRLTSDRSVVSRGEIALSRAMEVLRRLDTRNAHSNRSPVPHDDFSQASNPAYLVCFFAHLFLFAEITLL